LYRRDSLAVERYRRVCAGDQDLNSIHTSWEQSLRRAVEQLPDIEFDDHDGRIPLVAACEPPRQDIAPQRAIAKPGAALAASGESSRQPE
jgi:hypothetical protein